MDTAGVVSMPDKWEYPWCLTVGGAKADMTGKAGGR
jgi:hypothetical protein